MCQIAVTEENNRKINKRHLLHTLTTFEEKEKAVEKKGVDAFDAMKTEAKQGACDSKGIARGLQHG